MQLKDILNKAVEILIEKDSFLLEKDLNERSITHRLAMYLQQLLPNYDVDCEYNRNHENPKRLKLFSNDGNLPVNDTDGKTVFPDIIVHKRGTDTNILAIEVKKTTSNTDDSHDKEKLKEFKNELNYQNVCFLRLKTRTKDIGIDTFEFK
jgi:hypothetical protein